MRALTICQPYAHLIVIGEKRVENRTWATRYRGPLAIHAGKSLEWMGGEKPTADMAFGAVVGVADLVACIELDTYLPMLRDGSEYAWLATHKHANGPFCFVLNNVRRFAVPVPWKGAQGFWDVPSHALPSNACLIAQPEKSSQESTD